MHRERTVRDDYDYDRLLRKHKEERVKNDKYTSSRTDFRQGSDVYYSLCLNGLNQRIPQHVLRDAISKEFERFGDFTVKIVNNPDNRIAFVNFVDPEHARAAKYARKSLVLFDCAVRVDPVYPKNNRARSPNGYRDYQKSYRQSDRDYYYQNDKYYCQGGYQSGYSEKDRESSYQKFPHHLHHVPPEEDKYATRTLFVGNIDVNIREEDLRGIFDRYGTIEEIDIKRPPVPGKGNAYAFIKYFNVDMAHRAKCDMSGRFIGMFECKIGYGKPTPTNCLWIGGIGPWVRPEELEQEFDRFGVIERIEWPHTKGYAYVLFGTVDAATAANTEMRGACLGGSDKKIRVDYADESHMPSQRDLHSDGKASHATHESTRDHPPVRSDHRGSTMRDRTDTYKSAETHVRSSRSESDRISENHDRKRNRNSMGDDKSHKSQDGRSADQGERKRMRTLSPTDRDISRSVEKIRTSDRDGKDADDTLGGLEPSVDLQTVESIVDLSKALPIVWSGALVLKNSAFAARMHLVDGNVNLVDTLMRDNTSTEMVMLKITQRLRLDQPKLEEVGRRVSTSGPDGFAVLLAMTGPNESAEETTSENGTQHRPLRNLVSYLKQKDAAGVISLPPNPGKDKQNIGVLHAFPPSAFGFELLTKRAPNVCKETTKDDHLVVVVVRGAV